MIDLQVSLFALFLCLLRSVLLLNQLFITASPVHVNTCPQPLFLLIYLNDAARDVIISCLLICKSLFCFP